MNEYLKEPLEEYAKEQIVDFVQEFLIQKGYGKDQIQATVEFITHTGYNTDLSQFLTIECDNKFAAKLASIDVTKMYLYYAEISSIAKPVKSLYRSVLPYRNAITV